PEAFTLGEVTGRLHLALAEAFGTEPADPAAWFEGFRAALDRLPQGKFELGDETLDMSDLIDRAAVEAMQAEVLQVEDPGVGLRIHGDLHLGQLLLADAGWFVLDFE